MDRVFLLLFFLQIYAICYPNPYMYIYFSKNRTPKSLAYFNGILRGSIASYCLHDIGQGIWSDKAIIFMCGPETSMFMIMPYLPSL